MKCNAIRFKLVTTYFYLFCYIYGLQIILCYYNDTVNKNHKKGVTIMKKTWEMPSVEEVSISKTEHKWTGIYRDGGYIGDGIISGHLSWDKPDDSSQPDNPKTETGDFS